ncbi:MAG: hypothetical protein MJZ02_09165 [Paludibacteraceae bacterium]|nr:hypothetical protein [Paludibacteraceae bacterium]
MLPLPPPLPQGMPFMMPMFKEWVPKKIQPWIYVVTVFCVQFSSGVYLGALESIRGTTNFMLEDLLMLLYTSLAGMAIYFPMLFRMKFRFTNQQLLIGAAIVIGICNLIAIHTTNMAILLVVCFISGMAKLQGTFECMSNIQLWITPKRDFAVFFPVLHIVLLTSIEGSAWLAAWFSYHFSWQMMHGFSIGTMCLIVASQLILCRPFCPMPQRLSLKGIDFPSGLLISVLMLVITYILVYGDHYMWFSAWHIRILAGVGFLIGGFILYRLTNVAEPYVNLKIFTYKNVLPILVVMALGELLLGCEHTLEEIFYSEVVRLEEHTKESQYLWVLPGMYAGIAIDLFWLKLKKWKVWRLFGFGFGCILAYALLMYFNIDVNAPLSQYRLAIMLRGCACSILAATLMWSLDESIPDLEQFFMGLFVFNIVHMYLAGASGYGFYTTAFSHYLNDNIVRYGSQLSLTNVNPSQFDMAGFMDGYYIRSMISVALKQVYGWVIWFSGFLTLLFLLLDIPAVRTYVRKVPLWPVYCIEYVSRNRRRQ